MAAPTRVAIAVVESAGHVLVGTRPEGVPLAGMSEFPGGKCRPDETARGCAVRECREETGLLVVPRSHLVTTTARYAHGTIELSFWKCALSPDIPDLAMPDSPFEWVALRELDTRDFPSGNDAVLKLLRASAACDPTVGVIIVDHGSRRPESNDMLLAATRAFSEATNFDIVEPAHMEIAEPDIATAFDRCVKRGATRIVVFPYFLSPGRHWKHDIPDLVRRVAEKHPTVTWTVTEPFGMHAGMVEIMRERVLRAM